MTSPRHATTAEEARQLFDLVEPVAVVTYTTTITGEFEPSPDTPSPGGSFGFLCQDAVVTASDTTTITGTYT